MLDTSIIMGSKSGFTKGAGRCLASISEINGVDYLLVVIKSLVDKNYNAVDVGRPDDVARNICFGK